MQGLHLADCGKMVAVMADRAQVAPLLEGLDGVVVANANHPRQVVVSGTTPAVQAARERLERAELKVTALEVSHASIRP